jgi:hypothetical protein
MTSNVASDYFDDLRRKGLSFTFPLKPQFPYDDPQNPTGIFPGHAEHQKTGNGWPNAEGRVGCDSTLTYHRRQRKFTFNWVYLKDPPAASVMDRENQAVYLSPVHGDHPREGLHVVSIDPGVRALLTFYSPSKGFGEIGGKRPQQQQPSPTIPHRARRRRRSNMQHQPRPQKPVVTDSDHIFRLVMFVDKLVSKTANAPARKKANFRRAAARARDRIKWLVREVHCKAAKFLTDEFDIILLPAFESGRMSQRYGRNIWCKTVRQMLGWGHYRFRKCLEHKAEEKGKALRHPKEDYTTKTCPCCGRMRNVGGSKVYHCRSDQGGCGWKADRDVSSGMGIFLKSAADDHFVDGEDE